jgi:hypothetical protein
MSVPDLGLHFASQSRDSCERSGANHIAQPINATLIPRATQAFVQLASCESRRAFIRHNVGGHQHAASAAQRHPSAVCLRGPKCYALLTTLCTDFHGKGTCSVDQTPIVCQPSWAGS